LVVAPTEALVKNPIATTDAAWQRVGWHQRQLLQVLRKSYDVWTERELPVLVFDPKDGRLLQRLNFPALGPAAGIAWIDERLCVATGHGLWRLQPAKPNE
jgi:hypothetical protein